MSEKARPLTAKIHLYHALYLVNRGFDLTLTGLKRLTELGLFRNYDLREHEVNVELARCEANDELTGLLQSYEQDDEYYWEGHRDEFQKQRGDPDDVFFQARERKREIKQQIKNLQAASPASIPGGRSPKNASRPEKARCLKA